FGAALDFAEGRACCAALCACCAAASAAGPCAPIHVADAATTLSSRNCRRDCTEIQLTILGGVSEEPQPASSASQIVRGGRLNLANLARLPTNKNERVHALQSVPSSHLLTDPTSLADAAGPRFAPRDMHCECPRARSDSQTS